jgi:multidrug efflux pump subunit AcrA (membrane-fusion protein)
MQPHDPQPLPDDTSRTEGGAVSTAFQPGTGRTLKIGAGIAAGILVFCFCVVMLIRLVEAHSLRKGADAAYSAAPPVDVITAQPASVGQDLVLPGQTAAWYETTIYARVSGYVAKWMVDIGDHVKKGQVMALIETPELDAELAAARAQLKASEAQVAARQAEADFSKTTNERWRDSPKGVVSDQERESKKADYESANARLFAANAQVALDKSKVDQYTALAQFKQVVAPFDGTVTERKIDIGNLVTAGSGSTTTSLYRMAQTDPLRIFVDVPQNSAVELMKPGVPAEIRATGPSGGVFFRRHHPLGGIARRAGAHHACRGRHAECQSLLAAGHIRQCRLQAATARPGRSAGGSADFPAQGDASRARRCAQQNRFSGRHDRPR